MIQALLNSVCSGWQAEYQFHPQRKWRADFAHPTHKIIIEIEGGAFSSGRHVRGRGFLADMEKYNTAVLLGWRVLRYTPQQTAQMLEDVSRIVFGTISLGRIPLFPCGLAKIFASNQYMPVDKKRVLVMCRKLRGYGVCSARMRAHCWEGTPEAHNEGVEAEVVFGD